MKKVKNVAMLIVFVALVSIVIASCTKQELKDDQLIDKPEIKDKDI